MDFLTYLCYNEKININVGRRNSNNFSNISPFAPQKGYQLWLKKPNY